MLVMIDPDNPRRITDGKRAGALGPWIHWFVLNAESSAKAGYEAVSYHGPDPAPGTGHHRYIFLLFQQMSPPPKDFDLGSAMAQQSRALWPIKEFFDAMEAHIVPVAMNFFYAISKKQPTHGDDKASFYPKRDAMSWAADEMLRQQKAADKQTAARKKAHDEL